MWGVEQIERISPYEPLQKAERIEYPDLIMNALNTTYISIAKIMQAPYMDLDTKYESIKPIILSLQAYVAPLEDDEYKQNVKMINEEYIDDPSWSFRVLREILNLLYRKKIISSSPKGFKAKPRVR